MWLRPVFDKSRKEGIPAAVLPGPEHPSSSVVHSLPLASWRLLWLLAGPKPRSSTLDSPPGRRGLAPERYPHLTPQALSPTSVPWESLGQAGVYLCGDCRRVNWRKLFSNQVCDIICIRCALNSSLLKVRGFVGKIACPVTTTAVFQVKACVSRFNLWILAPIWTRLLGPLIPIMNYLLQLSLPSPPFHSVVKVRLAYFAAILMASPDSLIIFNQTFTCYQSVFS